MPWREMKIVRERNQAGQQIATQKDWPVQTDSPAITTTPWRNHGSTMGETAGDPPRLV